MSSESIIAHFKTFGPREISSKKGSNQRFQYCCKLHCWALCCCMLCCWTLPCWTINSASKSYSSLKKLKLNQYMLKHVNMSTCKIIHLPWLISNPDWHFLNHEPWPWVFWWENEGKLYFVRTIFFLLFYLLLELYWSYHYKKNYNSPLAIYNVDGDHPRG
jgi:hypothetical protein